MSDFFDSFPLNENVELPIRARAPQAGVDPDIQERCQAELLALVGAEGWAPKSPDRSVVYLWDNATSDLIPDLIAGRKVEPVVSGPIQAL